MLSFFTSTAGKWLICITIISVAVAVSLRQVRKIMEPPKPPRSESFVVADVPNGSTILVKAGLRDRQTRTVTLQHISTPDAADKYFVAAVANLKKLAGDTIRVETTSRGRLFGEAPDSKEQPVDATEPEAHGPIQKCSICGGTGIEVIDKSKMSQAAFAVWLDCHVGKCQRCKDAILNNEKCPDISEFCDEANAKWNKITEKLKDFDPIQQPCLCVEMTTVVEPESRGPILGVAYGQFGECLNLAQIMDGYASCLPSAPKEWKRQEAVAKKAKKGIWSNKNGK
jgi:hypothetical protein